MRACDKKDTGGPVITKKDIQMSGSAGIWPVTKKKHSLSNYRYASAARAGRQRSGPTVMAVRRRCDKKAPESPVSTTRQQNPPRAPRIYKYTIKSIILPLEQNPRPRNLSL